jgi:hypothetical protein
MPKDNRYTIAFSPAAELALKAAMDSTHCKSVPDIVRAATSVFVDLLDVQSRNLSIVFRDEASGSEWSYSPLNPGRASPLQKRDLTRKNNVIAGAFPPKRPDTYVPLGMNAVSNAGEQPGKHHTPPRQRGR